MLSSFLRPKQETTRTAFCNYLTLEVERSDNKDFQTFRNKTVKLPSSIQSRAEEGTHQPQQPQQQTLSHNSSATSTNCATDLSTANSTSCKGIHLNHLRESDAGKPGHPIHLAAPTVNHSTASTIHSS